MDASFKPIIVRGTTVGIDAYLGTKEEGELVALALIDFGFLLKPLDLQTHWYSFDQLANAIEANYCLENQRTAAIVAALREVQKRNA